MSCLVYHVSRGVTWNGREAEGLTTKPLIEKIDCRERLGRIEQKERENVRRNVKMGRNWWKEINGHVCVHVRNIDIRN